MDAQKLLEYKNWLVAGDVENKSKYAYRIKETLKKEGFNVFMLNPYSKSENIYKYIFEIKERIDVIDLCINPKIGIEIVKEAYKNGINKILIQPGAESEEILEFCNENDILAIRACVLTEIAYIKRKR
ncbi:CoA-binding protein [Clostridium cochlearium]|uniref:Predicted CoA-binding protein n=1 Tax=Clostridium cochlearium TaxID=1494 RepID=A0ABY0QKA2_CLOCO|nr:CoA-binding protein [Clostridium cochlearium]MBV1819320.1 CoA-binding protein [Bacteroidales bacterium MSK.15.36]NSJ90579.1 CoA-binding protein [Coprococcus sp. MSK.21.13]MCG4572898.1 CoA-binding protein [Clostridium cochlearium]MCG4579746.1 CoA-binding protein [Clostridium cochlearium]NME95161.1 CoA-binding protein [Clostridium cochlearium]